MLSFSKNGSIFVAFVYTLKFEKIFLREKPCVINKKAEKFFEFWGMSMKKL